MPEYQYIARESSGREVSGVLTAGNEDDALQQLGDRLLFPMQLGLAKQAKQREKLVGKRVSARYLVVFYSQLADLLHAGVPLLRALEILQGQMSQPTLSAVLTAVLTDVADGKPLADSLKRHPRVFSELAVSMIHAGEQGGFLDEVLKRIATFTEHQENMKSRVMGALAYPLFLMGASIAVVAALMVFLVPRFAPIFDRLKARGELPAATTILLGISSSLTNYGIVILIILIGIVVAIGKAAQSEKGRLLLDQWKLKSIGLGPILRSLAISRFCRILGTLLRNGVPILQSLKIAKDATGNLVLSQAIEAASENVQSGKSLAKPLASSGQFSRDIVEMIAVGEEANNLEQVLLNISENMEQRTYSKLELFVRLLEPVLLLCMAVMILFIMIALLLPVFSSSNALG
ncbi:MAG: type II secretion system F family protein [Planctomycetales bacterium]